MVQRKKFSACSIILSAILILIVASFALWNSKWSTGLKLRIGHATSNDALLLAGANIEAKVQDRGGVLNAIKLKIRISERQMRSALSLLNEMIDKAPDDPNIYVTRARLWALNGQNSKELDDLLMALSLDEQEAEVNYPLPSGVRDRVDELIEQTRSEKH